MKCPLLHHKENNPDIYPSECFEDCLKEECAWWDSTAGKCAVLQLAFELDEVHCQLSELSGK